MNELVISTKRHYKPCRVKRENMDHTTFFAAVAAKRIPFEDLDYYPTNIRSYLVRVTTLDVQQSIIKNRFSPFRTSFILTLFCC